MFAIVSFVEQLNFPTTVIVAFVPFIFCVEIELMEVLRFCCQNGFFRFYDIDRIRSKLYTVVFVLTV